MGRRLELGGGGSILISKAKFDRCRIPRLIVEEQDHDKLDKLEEQEQKEVQELLDEQLEDWGSDKIKEREQKDKENRSNIPKIKEKSKGGKREQDQRGEGSRSKKLRYKRTGEKPHSPVLISGSNVLPPLLWRSRLTILTRSSSR